MSEETKTSCRLMLLPVIKSVALELFTGKARLLLPEGTTIEDVTYQFEYERFLLKLHHESFHEVRPNCPIQIMDEVLCERMQEWTTQQPTVDGYYWWRHGPTDDEPEIALVCGDEVTDMGDASPWEMKHHQGEWIGPLMIPK